MPALKSNVPENSSPSIRYLCSESSEPRDATYIWINCSEKSKQMLKYARRNLQRDYIVFDKHLYKHGRARHRRKKDSEKLQKREFTLFHNFRL